MKQHGPGHWTFLASQMGNNRTDYQIRREYNRLNRKSLIVLDQAAIRPIPTNDTSLPPASVIANPLQSTSENIEKKKYAGFITNVFELKRVIFYSY